MNIEQILELDVSKIKNELLKEPKSTIIREPLEWQKQYEGEHKILQRPNKNVGSPAKVYDDGTKKEDTRKTVITNKLKITKQKQIVRSAVAFCIGGGCELSLANSDDNNLQEAYSILQESLKSVKIDNFNYKLVKTLCKESKVAELWYIEAKENGNGIDKKLKNYLLSYENGDEFYPHFNNYGDMDAFTRKYSVKNNGKDIEKVVVYTADKTVTLTATAGGNYKREEVENPFGKIPVIYYDQLKPEWLDVEELIERMEMVLSKFADTNDYFASPAVKSKGRVMSPPSKDEVGKWFQIEGEETADGKIEYGDIEYLVWKHSPEAVKFEIKTLTQYINNMTSTPDISFTNMKEMNGNISGVALKLLFLDSILKAIDKRQTIIDEGFTRRINLLKEMLAYANSAYSNQIKQLDITLSYRSSLPDNITEIIENIAKSRPTDNLISRKTAVQKHPFVENYLAELENLKGEDLEQNAAGTFEFE